MAQDVETDTEPGEGEPTQNEESPMRFVGWLLPVMLLLAIPGELREREQNRIDNRLAELARVFEEGDGHEIEEILAVDGLVSQRSESGETALSLAAAHGDLETVRRLIASGATAFDHDAEGRPVPCRAAEVGRPEVLSFLLEQRGGTRGQECAGHTLLGTAVRMGHVPAVELLLSRGEDPNGRSRNGDTPLMLALIGNRDGATVRLLLDAGADPDLRSLGFTPRQWARSRGDRDLLELFGPRK